MQVLRRLLALYDWVSRVHLALFGLGGAGVLVALAADLAELPVPAALFGALGASALAFGVIGLFRSRQTAHLPAVLTPPEGQSPPDRVRSPASASAKSASAKPRLVARNDQLAHWRAERDVLIDEGDDVANELRLMDVDAATEKDVHDIHERGTQFLQDVKDHQAKWWSGLSLVEHAGILAQILTTLDTPVPGPAWRAQLVARIEYDVDWLRNRGRDR